MLVNKKEINMEESDKVKVKNIAICDSQSIPETREAKRQSNKVKNEPIDIKIEAYKSQIEVKTKEKFWSSREEFVSISFLNEATSSNSEPSKPDSK